MRYYEIEPMCKPIGTRGCPHDGLGCTGSEECSINSRDPRKAQKAFEADRYGPDFICAKRNRVKGTTT